MQLLDGDWMGILEENPVANAAIDMSCICSCGSCCSLLAIGGSLRLIKAVFIVADVVFN